MRSASLAELRGRSAKANLSLRSVRLASGLALGAFLLTHFINLSAGLISPRAMDAVRPFLTGLWSNPVGFCVLYSSLSVHVGLTLRALYRRRTLAMSGGEILQLAFGLLFPFLLVAHVLGTEIVPLLTGRRMPFANEVYQLWVVAPPMAGRQIAALVVGWCHACLGLWFWLRSKAWFQQAAPLLLAAALIVPLTATLGFVEAARTLAREPPAPYDLPPVVITRASEIGVALYFGLAALMGGVLVAMGARRWASGRSRITIEYPDGKTVSVPVGFSILEASRSAGIPHLSVCGGRGRCSTCRVRIMNRLAEQPIPDAVERATLEQIKAEPGVRLACQLRPTHDVAVFPLFSPLARKTVSRGGAHVMPPATGIERDIAVLFCDLRGFTRHAERLLPYDTVFLLNRYFQLVGSAVDASGGHLDKFIGDGALALFGLKAAPDEACRQALKAAALIARGLDDLNAHVSSELNEPLRIAMGLHFGPAVIGEMGYGRATGFTAIGDGINVASRLEHAAKHHGVEAVVSTALIGAAGVQHLHGAMAITVAGRSAPVEAVLIGNARGLG